MRSMRTVIGACVEMNRTSLSDAEAAAGTGVRAGSAGLGATDWVLGRGWDQNDWPEQVFPTAADLDAAFPDRPVWLARIDGHAGWANSAALRALDPRPYHFFVAAPEHPMRLYRRMKDIRASLTAGG